MKMADLEKTEEFVDAECPSERLDEAQSTTTSVQDEHLKTETTTSTSSPPREKEDDSPVHTEGEQSLLSMPCLMKELRRDSPESQQASMGSEKPASRHIYESDSSNPCMLSPSSSGHLADSDTLSSGGEGDREETETKMEADVDKDRQPSGRKSRRSRSESEAPPNAMAAKKNRCQPAGAGGPEKQINGKQAKVKGHRSQKHKERMRLLRQKREAAARKKYNLLQDSSTSDSELTCDSSTSSSDDDDDDTSGGSKTIKTDIPGHAEAETSHNKDGRQHKGRISIASSDSEVEIVGVQENARCAHPCGGVIKSLSSCTDDHSAERSAAPNTTTHPPPQLWTCVSPQSNWVSPPEVVDLTLDEENSGHKHLP
ncbi:uncharacterized protein C18orf25 homolog isoform X3 [Syngnathus typhle]|uniref:uncharacterized protein C18orf25 homolog isoform X3 n=1 Tax=Syngnathus typhle TaxID=161592 RepID=UPI002A6B39BD|nr:uncharacterized protein C18orf25 homolog isoform X3 [Syngnathus typhle]